MSRSGRQRSTRPLRVAFGFLVSVLIASTSAGFVFANSLGLRVQDAEAVPGSMVAVVLRTYESRPIGQGQLCLEANPVGGGGSRAFSTFEGGQVFSAQDDAGSDVVVVLEQDPQTILLSFNSPSATININDGPLAVLYFRLDETVLPGEQFALTIDLANSALTDGNGLPIPIDPRSGSLRVRAPTDPVSASAGAESTIPGADAVLTFETIEPVPLSSGGVGIRYDPAIAAGVPTVGMDPRHGTAVFNADISTPGLVVVDFQSPDHTLNLVPGSLVEVHLPTIGTIEPGTQSPVSLDPELTFLNDALGVPLPLQLIGDLVEFVAPRPGVVSGLTLGREPGGDVLLTWNPDCGFGEAYGIYRGDLLQGYSSLSIESGLCSVAGTSVTIPAGPGAADFFLVVPNVNAEEGSYGLTSLAGPRQPAVIACFPMGSVAECGP